MIELILVLGLLSIVFSLAAPSLARFFRGRTLDSEAKRFLSLTRYGQSRAVSEGVPMVLWIDEEQGTYGLQAATGFVQADSNAMQFKLAERLEFDVTAPVPAATEWTPWNRTSPGSINTMGSLNSAWNHPGVSIHFQPDGFIAETSPQQVGIRETEDHVIWIAQGPNRLNYDIQTANTRRR